MGAEYMGAMGDTSFDHDVTRIVAESRPNARRRSEELAPRQLVVLLTTAIDMLVVHRQLRVSTTGRRWR